MPRQGYAGRQQDVPLPEETGPFETAHAADWPPRVSPLRSETASIVGEFEVKKYNFNYKNPIGFMYERYIND
jgi:hypothetical protein